jgi:hypothetical protein
MHVIFTQQFVFPAAIRVFRRKTRLTAWNDLRVAVVLRRHLQRAGASPLKWQEEPQTVW